MRRFLYAAFVTLALAGTAHAERCVLSSDKETWQYQYCPKGVVKERQRIGYGFGWGEWKPVHPNVDPPCKWVAADNQWKCTGSIITCTNKSCY